MRFLRHILLWSALLAAHAPLSPVSARERTLCSVSPTSAERTGPAVPRIYTAAEQSEPSTRKKVAVVLSGGGAKGVAHIGALRVIEQAGIPIDIIVGTSMGAIVGGFYSIGYTTEQLDSMGMSQDWGLLLSDRTPRRNQPFSEKEEDERYIVSYKFGHDREAASGPQGFIRGTNLEMLFNDMVVGYHDSLDFRRLPVQFACVAANIVDGSEVVFDSGALPVAMRASMAIPGVFTPVYLGDAVLVDGGVLNNFPTDIARAMGADVVIGVDVQSGLREKDELTAATTVLRQIVEMTMHQQNYQQKIADTDLYVKVDVTGYSSASFNTPALDSLIDRGYRSTLAHRGELVRLRRSLDPDGSDLVAAVREPFVPLSERGTFHVYNVDFEGLTPRQRRWVMRKCRIRENSNMSVRRLEHCMSILGATTSHTGIYYSMRDTLEGYNLEFHMDAIRGNSVNAGVEFDTEEIASVLVNGTMRFGERMPMEASVTGRFGKRLALGARYAFLTSPLSDFRFGYSFNYDDVVIHSGGHRLYNAAYNRHTGYFSFVNMNSLRQNLRTEVGLAFRKYDYRSLLADYREWDGSDGRPIPEANLMADLDTRLWNYFVRADYETLDSRYFPHRGTSISLDVELITDNLYRWDGGVPLSAVSLSWITAVPLSPRFSIIPGVYGRAVSPDAPFPLCNMIGGRTFGRYMPQQMPFDGVGYVEMAPAVFVAARLQARYRIGARHHAAISANYGVGAADIHSFTFRNVADEYLGVSVDYGYDLNRFPLQASLGWSNLTKSVGLYLQAGYMF